MHSEEMFLSPIDGFGGLPLDNFDAELSEFLQGNANLGLMEGW